MLRNHISIFKGYSINLTFSLLFLHFIYLIGFWFFIFVFAIKVLTSSLSTILPNLVSKENLEKNKDKIQCKEFEGKEQRRGRGFGGQTAGEWEKTCHQHVSSSSSSSYLRPGHSHCSFLCLPPLTSRPSSIGSEGSCFSSLLPHRVILLL